MEPPSPPLPEACRICYEDGEMVSPCKCSGTTGHVHKECLLKWLYISRRTDCEICHFVYSFHDEYVLWCPCNLHATLCDISGDPMHVAGYIYTCIAIFGVMQFLMLLLYHSMHVLYASLIFQCVMLVGVKVFDLRFFPSLFFLKISSVFSFFAHCIMRGTFYNDAFMWELLALYLLLLLWFSMTICQTMVGVRRVYEL